MNGLVEQLNRLSEALVDFAIPMLIQSSILIAVVLGLDLLLRRRVRAVTRYCLWLLVLVKLVLPINLSSPVSLGYLFGERLTNVDIADLAPTPAQSPPVGPTTLPFGLDSGAFLVPPEPSGVVPIPSDGRTVRQSDGLQPPAVPVTWRTIAMLLWAAVVAGLLLLLGQRVLFVKGLVAQAKPADASLLRLLDECRAAMDIRTQVGLRISPNATSPAVCGLLHPVILIPQNLTPALGRETLRAVLLHELAHVKRRDLWANLIQTLLQIAYFYNPLLWPANAMIRRLREKSVDEMVLVALGGPCEQYGDTLVRVAKLAFDRPALSLRLIGVVESRSALKGRIRHILSRPLPRTAKLGAAGLAALVIAAVLLLPMACSKSDNGGRPADTTAQDEPEQSQEETPFMVHGVVTDASGEPMAGVTARASCGMGSLRPTGRTVTDSNGVYELYFRPGMHIVSDDPNEWKVGFQAATIYAEKDGFYEVSLCRAGNLAMSDREPDAERMKHFVGVVLPDKPYELNFTMTPGATVKGTLVDPVGRPMPDRRFHVAGETLYPSTNVLADVTTDARGEFTLANVPLEPFWFAVNDARTEPVRFQSPGSYRLKLTCDESTPNKTVVTCEVLERPQAAHAATVDLRHSDIRVCVVGIDGKAIGGGQVALQVFTGGDVDDESNYHHYTVRTDPNGSAVFEDVEAGSAHIGRLFTADDETDGQVQGAVYGLNHQLKIEPGKDYDVTLAGKGRPVAGRLAAVSGRPDIDWTGARAYLHMAAPHMSMMEINAGFYAAMKTQDAGDFYSHDDINVEHDGRFRIEGVRAGEYMLRVSHPDYKIDGWNVFHSFVVPLMKAGTNDKPLNLGELSFRDELSPAPMQPAPRNLWMGTLVFDEDQRINLMAGTDEEPNVVTSKQIRFSKNGDAVRAVAKVRWTTISDERWRARVRLLTKNGSTAAQAEVLFETIRRIKGVPVVVEKDSVFELGAVDTSKTPRYVFEIAPVADELEAAASTIAPGIAEATPAVKPEQAAAQASAAHPGRITGVVMDAGTGGPVAGAYVGTGDFGDSGGSNYARHEAQGLHAKTKTDAEGRFELAGLALTEGHEYLQQGHPLVVTHPDYVRHDEKVALSQGDPTAEVKVLLQRAARIDVTIVDSAGQPVDGHWLLRLEDLSGRTFIPLDKDPHLSSFASSVWTKQPDLRRDMGRSSGSSFGPLAPGLYRIEAIRMYMADNPSPEGIWRPVYRYHGAIDSIGMAPGRTQQVRITPANHETVLAVRTPAEPFEQVAKLETAPPNLLKDQTIRGIIAISRQPGVRAWDMNRVYHVEDARLGRIQKTAMFFTMSAPGETFVMENLPPGSYSVFAMANVNVVMVVSSSQVELRQRDKVELLMTPGQVDGVGQVKSHMFDHSLSLEKRQYSLPELCAMLTALTQPAARWAAGDAVAGDKVSMPAGRLTCWQVVERLYEQGYAPREQDQNTLIIGPKALVTPTIRPYTPPAEPPSTDSAPPGEPSAADTPEASIREVISRFWQVVRAQDLTEVRQYAETDWMLEDAESFEQWVRQLAETLATWQTSGMEAAVCDEMVVQGDEAVGLIRAIPGRNMVLCRLRTDAAGRWIIVNINTDLDKTVSMAEAVEMVRTRLGAMTGTEPAAP